MRTNRRWILFLLEIVSLCAVVSAELNYEDQSRINITRELSTRFQDFRMHRQYAVMYVPLPESLTSVTYEPELIFPPPDCSRNKVLFPDFPQCNPSPEEFRYNYAVANPDIRAVYRHVLGRPRSRAIHTEDLFINLLLERMFTWYNRVYGQYPSAVYMYSYFVPCPRCFEIIRHTVQNTLFNHEIPLYVAYSQLGGVRNESISVANDRAEALRAFLNHNNGSLFYIGESETGTDEAICVQQGVHRRQRRHVSVFDCSEDEWLFLKMDFNTGKAVVVWHQPVFATNEYAWVGLYNQQNTRLTWQYLNTVITGNLTFNYYMSDGFEVRLSNVYDENFVRTSYPWNNCGFGWKKMNNLPANYGDVYLALTITNGYPKAMVSFCQQNVATSYDYVALESIDQAVSGDEDNYQWISSFTVSSNIAQYTFGYRLNMADGIRAKYVYATSRGYYREGMNDNATPFWTPEGCTGVQASESSNYNTDPCSARTTQENLVPVRDELRRRSIRN